MRTVSLRRVAATLVHAAALGAGPDPAVGLVAVMLPEDGAPGFQSAGLVDIVLIMSQWKRSRAEG